MQSSAPRPRRTQVWHGRPSLEQRIFLVRHAWQLIGRRFPVDRDEEAIAGLLRRIGGLNECPILSFQKQNSVDEGFAVERHPQMKVFIDQQ